MDTKLIFVVLVVALLPSALAIIVAVEVGEVIDGYSPYFEVGEGVQNVPQRFLMVWENSGSLGCSVLMQVEVYKLGLNGSKLVSTSWSNDTPLESGGTGTLEAYWPPEEPGDYMANLTLHLCRRIVEGPVVNFSVKANDKGFEKAPFEIRGITNDYERIIIDFESRRNMEDLVIIPSGYPRGWVVQSRSVKGVEANKTYYIGLAYEPAIWGEKSLSIGIVTKDGRYSTKTPYTLQKVTPGFWDVWTIPILIFLVIILVVTNLIAVFWDKITRFNRRHLTKKNLGSKLDRFRKEKTRENRKGE
jgi:hypothetical protein